MSIHIPVSHAALRRALPPLLLLSAPQWAGASGVPAAAVAADMSGHYYLEGVMEMGSELLLGPTGQFRWYLSYGSLDLYAEGQWRQVGNSILLINDKSADPNRPGFERLSLDIDGQEIIPPDGRGAYRRAGSQAAPDQ